MSMTIDDALKDNAIDHTQKTDSGYSFWLKNIPVEIRVTLPMNPVRGGFDFQLSHSIHTPTQIDKYRISQPWGDDEGYALHLAVTTITSYYRDAVAAGFEASQDWLVKND